MSRFARFAAAMVVVALGTFVACSPEPPGVASLSLTPVPRTLDGKGQTSELKIEARDQNGKPGTGTVKLLAEAGTLSSEEVTLDANGKASTSFSCVTATDSNCAGSVRVDAVWDNGGSEVAQTALIFVGERTQPTPDAGNPGGSDAGTPEDGGTSDGGLQFGDDLLSVVLEKNGLVIGTGDNADITAFVKRPDTGDPLPDVQVSFKTTAGSFEATPGTANKVVTTDAQGQAKVTLHVAGAQAGRADLTIRAAGSEVKASINLVAVASIVYQSSTKPALGIQSSGRDTTTQIIFTVMDADQEGLEGIEVNFEVAGAAGASVLPVGISDASGNVSTTLKSGDSPGIATVKATVTATAGNATEVSGTHPGTPIITGRPSDSAFWLRCERYNLGARHSVIPPRYLNTECRVKVTDRDHAEVGLQTTVQWFAEAGAINPTSNTDPSGEAVTTFTTTSMPQEVPADTAKGEPTFGSKNPRDMLVTIIAVVAGEETFFDGSGASNGTKNGQWDQGEWFVDLPEPFIDANDNNQYDLGEDFKDTERIDCANPSAPPTRNGKWDPPNGCWDGNTQIWRAIHVVYTGPLLQAPVLSPPEPVGGYYVPADSIFTIDFTWADEYGLPLSPDNAGFFASLLGKKGSASVDADAPNYDWFGFKVAYEDVVAKETSTGSGTFTEQGPCNQGLTAPPDPLTRCIRKTRIGPYGSGNSGTIILTNTPATALTDGGVAPPSPATVTITGGNSLSAPSSFSIDADFQ